MNYLNILEWVCNLESPKIFEMEYVKLCFKAVVWQYSIWQCGKE